MFSSFPAGILSRLFVTPPRRDPSPARANLRAIRKHPFPRARSRYGEQDREKERERGEREGRKEKAKERKRPRPVALGRSSPTINYLSRHRVDTHRTHTYTHIDTSTHSQSRVLISALIGELRHSPFVTSLSIADAAQIIRDYRDARQVYARYQDCLNTFLIIDAPPMARRENSTSGDQSETSLLRSKLAEIVAGKKNRSNRRDNERIECVLDEKNEISGCCESNPNTKAKDLISLLFSFFFVNQTLSVEDRISGFVN